tara:strand:- start:4110 stop:4760 length:651 start_codon:yes stop_codon:yes gene_type:complete
MAKKGFIDIEVKQLVKADWNYKQENEIQTENLINNFKRNGQIENIIIRELDSGFFEVVNGNHRVDVMKILKNKKAHAYNCGKISLAEAQRLAIETNETKFESDNLKMADLISTLAKEFPVDELALTMPYSEDEIQKMSELTDFDWSQYDSDEEIATIGDDEFNKEIKFMVTAETFDRWNDLKARVEKIGGYSSDAKVFEFAIIEALNIPEECLGVS